MTSTGPTATITQTLPHPHCTLATTTSTPTVTVTGTITPNPTISTGDPTEADGEHLLYDRVTNSSTDPA
jgi:hypothetical protein